MKIHWGRLTTIVGTAIGIIGLVFWLNPHIDNKDQGTIVVSLIAFAFACYVLIEVIHKRSERQERISQDLIDRHAEIIEAARRLSQVSASTNVDLRHLTTATYTSIPGAWREINPNAIQTDTDYSVEVEKKVKKSFIRRIRE